MGKPHKRITIEGRQVFMVPYCRILSAFLVFVYSSSSRQVVMENTTTFSIMLKQMRHIFLGLLIVFVAHLFPLGFYRKAAYAAYVAGLILVVYTLFGGITLNDSTRWLSILGFRFQPSEFAKIFWYLL